MRPAEQRRDVRRVGSGEVFSRMLSIVYLLVLAVALLVPDPRAVGTFKYNIGWRIQRLAPWLDAVPRTAVGDIASNIVAFILLSFLLAMSWRRVPAWVWGVVGTLISVAAESAQFLLPELSRRSDVWNVVENSIGAWTGAGTAALIRRCTHRTPR